MKLQLTSILAVVAVFATFTTSPPRAEMARHELLYGHKKGKAGMKKGHGWKQRKEARREARRESCKALKFALKGAGGCARNK